MAEQSFRVGGCRAGVSYTISYPFLAKLKQAWKISEWIELSLFVRAGVPEALGPADPLSICHCIWASLPHDLRSLERVEPHARPHRLEACRIKSCASALKAPANLNS